MLYYGRLHRFTPFGCYFQRNTLCKHLFASTPNLLYIEEGVSNPIFFPSRSWDRRYPVDLPAPGQDRFPSHEEGNTVAAISISGGHYARIDIQKTNLYLRSFNQCHPNWQWNNNLVTRARDSLAVVSFNLYISMVSFCKNTHHLGTLKAFIDIEMGDEKEM